MVLLDNLNNQIQIFFNKPRSNSASVQLKIMEANEVNIASQKKGGQRTEQQITHFISGQRTEQQIANFISYSASIIVKQR